MKEKQVKLPGPDHPISIERNPARVVVYVAGRRIVADTRNALTLREAAYPPVQYIPPEDVDFSQFQRTDHVTYCPYKGPCNYYSVPAGGKKSVNTVWSYDDPFSAVVQIKGHVAFYPKQVGENSRAADGVKKEMRGKIQWTGPNRKRTRRWWEGIRHVVQQARLRGSGASVVTELHSTQRSHRAWS